MIICGVSYAGTETPACATAATVPPATDGPQGFNWFQLSRPEIQINFSEAASPTNSDKVFLYLNNAKVAEFERYNTTDTFVGVSGNTAVMTYAPKGSTSDSDISTYTIKDVAGDTYTFFGFDHDTSPQDVSQVVGQLWKAVAPDGSTTCIGSPVSPTSLTSAYAGFVQDGFGDPTNRPQTVYDTAGQRRTYTYTSSAVGSKVRYESITIARDIGGGTWKDISKEEYVYYTSNTANGLIGDLKRIDTTVYLTDTGSPVTLTKSRYFRYYVANGSNGGEHQLRVSLDAEGYRRYMQDIGTSLDDVSITDSVLMPYASAYLEYYPYSASTSDFKVKKLVTNANCSCGSGSAQTYEYTYDRNAGFVSSNPTNPETVYDGQGDWTYQKWTRRQVIKYPDGMYKTIYVDEWDRTLAEVVSNGDPATSNRFYWVTKYLRDGNTRVEAIASPEAVTAYDHSGSFPGSITLSTSVGLVTYRSYHGSFNSEAVTKEAHSEGYQTSTSSRMLDRETDFEISTPAKWKETFGNGEIRKPFPIAVRTFKNEFGIGFTSASDYDQIDYVYTFWNSDPWQVKSVQTKLPYVAIANNGAGTSGSPDFAPLVSTKRYFDQGGRLAFTETNDGRFNYMEYDSRGQMTRSIQDVQANGSDTPLAAAASAHSLTLPGSATNLVTTTTYDNQGRPDTTTLPTGRVMAMFYSKLNDGRFATLSVPQRTGTSPLVYHGPVSYSVTNQAGRSEGSGVLALAGSSNDAQSIASWIDTTKSDPIQAIVGTYASVSRYSATAYNKAGTIMEESRVYHTLSSTLAGSTADVTKVVHDNRGRVIRTEDPTGTISRTDFDYIGRPVARWVGTDDTGLPGSTMSGTDNMTQVEVREYDGITSYGSGGMGKNSRLTRRISDADGDWVGTPGDQRQTDFEYDYRGRLIVQTNPVSPHAVFKYDNRGRRIAAGTFSSTSGFTFATDPTSTTTNRLSLSETEFDERGQVWHNIQHKITQSTGAISGGNELETLNWYDGNGRLIKTISPSGLSKVTYDRLDRTIRNYMLANTDDSAYAHAADVGGDIVLEETVTNYDDASGNVLWSMQLSRLPTDTTTDDILDTAGQPNTSLARAQITASWYDDLDRQIVTANYGTNHASSNGASFTYGSVPSPNAGDATKLVTATSYTKDGLTLEVTDARNIKTRFVYDAAGRETATITNYVNGVPSAIGADDDNIVRKVYTNGQLTKLWVDLDGDNVEDLTSTGQDHDQVTEYIYGTTKGTMSVSGGTPVSEVATGHLLSKTIYPPQTSSISGSPQSASDRSVGFAYNALSEQVLVMDQNVGAMTDGTILRTVLDNGGRRVAQVADYLGTGVSGWVRRVELTYTDRGQPESITQFDATTGGSEVNGMEYTYDDYGSVASLKQDFDSAVTTVSPNHKTVSWSTILATPADGRRTLRRTQQTFPDGSLVKYDYGTADLFNDQIGRVESVIVNQGSDITVASYEYLGAGQVASQTLDYADQVNSFHASGAFGTYLDRYNRVIRHEWTRNGGAGTSQRFDVEYDNNSNILMVIDPLLGAYDGISTWNNVFSMKIDVDNRNRVTRADRGEESGGSIIGTMRLNQLWNLSQTGNWTNFKNDLDGDSNGTDPNETNEDRTFSDANEILTRVTAGPTTATQTHDKAGQLTDDGKDFTYVYDAWGRLKTVKTRGGSPATVAEYAYNGLGQRIGWHYDANADTSVNSSDPWYWFILDDRWRIVSTYRVAWSSPNWVPDGDTRPKERFVHHAAGFDGSGGSSYIDAQILSDRDNSSGWTSQGDQTLEERYHYLQNWRNDLCALTNDGGVIVRRFRYSAYGSRTEIAGADYNVDGTVDFADYLDWVADFSAPNDHADVNEDGAVDFFDYADFVAITATDGADLAGGETRNLYAGYENDPALEQVTTSGGAIPFKECESTYHVRNRVLSTELGSWIRRDPIGYADGVSLTEHVRSNPIANLDETGLCSSGHCYSTQRLQSQNSISLGMLIPPFIPNYNPWPLFDPSLWISPRPVGPPAAGPMPCSVLADIIESYLKTPEEKAAWRRFVSGSGQDIWLTQTQMQGILASCGARNQAIKDLQKKCRAGQPIPNSISVSCAAPPPWTFAIGNYSLKIQAKCTNGWLTWREDIFDLYDFNPTLKPGLLIGPGYIIPRPGDWSVEPGYLIPGIIVPWRIDRGPGAEAKTLAVLVAQYAARCGWSPFHIRGTSGDCSIGTPNPPWK